MMLLNCQNLEHSNCVSAGQINTTPVVRGMLESDEQAGHESAVCHLQRQQWMQENLSCDNLYVSS